jgi:hypothetical protein
MTERIAHSWTDPRAVFGTVDPPRLPRDEAAVRAWEKLLRGWCPGLMDARSIVFMPFPPGGPFHAS